MQHKSALNHPKAKDARDLQVHLYREIGISAVTAALRFTTQPDPVLPKAASGVQAKPAGSRDDLAA